MTRKEAIEILNRTTAVPDLPDENMELWGDALDMAVDALYTIDISFGDYVDAVWEEAYAMGKQDALRGVVRDES